MSKGQAKELQESHNPRFTLSTANFRTLEIFPLRSSSGKFLFIFKCLNSLRRKKPKNLLELANRSRNTCKFANKLMTDTSG